MNGTVINNTTQFSLFFNTLIEVQSKIIYLECEEQSSNIIKIYEEIKQNLADIKKLQIIYKKEKIEHVTENISLDWINIVDSHHFFKWLEIKIAQKKKYNTQEYQIVICMELNLHTYR